MLKFLNFQTKNITLASFILASTSLASALLGMLRDRLLAGSFGAGKELDAYYAAFRVPDFIATVLVLGAISASIMPIFSEYLARSKEDAWRFFSNLLNLFLFGLVIICGILIVFMPWLINLIVPGFSGEEKELTVFLSRIMFLSPIFLGISNIISGILRIFHRFFITSLAPIMYNLGIIAGILFFFPRFGISGLAWGVAFGGLLHLLIQLPILSILGFRPRLIFKPFEKGMLRAIKLTIPRSLGLAANQINIIVITGMASTLAAGSITVFNFANNLQNLAVTFFAVSFSTAAFSFLANSFARGEKERFVNQFNSSFRQILFLTIPASLLLFSLRLQIVRLILGAGRFSADDIRLTAACLALFSFGIFASSLSLLLAKTFYAFQNTKTPAKIAIITVIINVLFSFLFVKILGYSNVFRDFVVESFNLGKIENIEVAALPLALSLSGIFQFLLLIFSLQKEIGNIGKKEIWLSFKKIVISSFIMLVFVYLFIWFMGNILNTQSFSGVFRQTFFAGIVGILSYISVSYCLKSAELKLILNSRKEIDGEY